MRNVIAVVLAVSLPAFGQSDLYYVELWAKQAGLACVDVRDITMVGTRPVLFTCITSKKQHWMVWERPCRKHDLGIPIGGKLREPGKKFVFRPAPAICWSVRFIASASTLGSANERV